MQPAFGGKACRWDDQGNRKNGRPRWLKKGETGRRSCPLERLAKQVLPLGIRRHGFYGCYLLDFRTRYSCETSRQASGERAYG